MLHISPDYLARVETGTQPVTYRMIERINRYTDWNSDYILHEIDNTNPFLDMYMTCPDKRKKVFIRNALCLFDSMLQIVNGMELDVPDNVRIGYTLTELRRILDMDKHMMAQAVGMTDRSFCSLENGLSKPDVGVLQIIYTIYGFNIKYFISRNPLECEAISNIYRGFDEPLRDFIMRRIRDDYDEIIIMRGRTYGRDI